MRRREGRSEGQLCLLLSFLTLRRSRPLVVASSMVRADVVVDGLLAKQRTFYFSMLVVEDQRKAGALES